MGENFRFPKDESELQEREAAGLWRAQALAKSIGEKKQKVTLDVIARIHRVFFEHVNPDIAGKFRVAGQDIKKLKCMTPPPGIAVRNRMYEFWHEFDVRMASIPHRPPAGRSRKAQKKQLAEWNERVIDLAAWTQHQIAAIHPFVEGNGRMARLMTNLVLYRFGLQPTDIKYEGENKQRYLDALCAIDLENDYRRLKQLILKGTFRSYQQLLEAQKKAKAAARNK